jgi:hypothetical protein
MEFMALSPKSMEDQGTESWIYEKNIRAWSPKSLEDQGHGVLDLWNRLGHEVLNLLGCGVLGTRKGRGVQISLERHAIGV